MHRWVRITALCMLAVSGCWVGGHGRVPAATVPSDKGLQAAFVRGGNLWLKVDKVERKLTDGQAVSSPEWSFDGQWIAYFVANDRPNGANESMSALHMRNVQTKRDFIINYFQKDTPVSYQWAPNKDSIAFQVHNLVNITDIKQGKPGGFRNVSPGVDSFAWQPNGHELLVSSRAHALPDGWTQVMLYGVSTNPSVLMTDNAKRFATLPHQLHIDGHKIMPTGTSLFKWSPDGKWLAFIASPTAGISADNNALCVLSADGRHLYTVGEMLYNPTWFAWAPDADTIAFIGGEGRLDTRNKALALASAPTFTAHRITPKGKVDNDLTWTGQRSIVVSRQPESADPWHRKETEMPVLYQVSGKEMAQQKQISFPPAGFQDRRPTWVSRTDQLYWLREGDTMKSSDVWLAAPDGTGAHRWISGVQYQHIAVY